LVSISPYGNCSFLPYAAMGSGSLAAIAILETKFRDDLSLSEGKDLVMEAIEAGIVHDMGSGGFIDICVITAKGTEFLRNIKKDYKRLYTKNSTANGYQFPKGITPVLETIKISFEKVEKMEEEKPLVEKMEIVKWSSDWWCRIMLTCYSIIEW